MYKSVKNRKKATALKGPTGCGKSVFLVDMLASHKVRAIMVVPNRNAVYKLCGYTTKIFKHHKIGYRMHADSKSGRYDDVTIMTTGYFLEYLIYHPQIFSEPLLLVIDECHDPSWQTDLLVRIALANYHKSDNIKLILASATLDLPAHDYEVIEMEETKPNVSINFKYEGKLEALMYKLLITELIQVNTLIFFAGEDEINMFMSYLEEQESHPFLDRAHIKPLHSKLTQEEIDDALTLEDGWNITLTTNIIETAITLPGYDAVIDTAMRKVAIQTAKGPHLSKVKAAKSNLIQSTGRVGRCGKEGKAYIMMHPDVYRELDEYPEREIFNGPVYNQLFRLIRSKFPIYEVLPPEIHHTVKLNLLEMEKYKLVNFKSEEIELTDAGRVVSDLQLSLKSANFLMKVIQYYDPNIWYWGLVIATWIDLNGDLFYSARKKFKESDLDFTKRVMQLKEKQRLYINPYEDYLYTALTIWRKNPSYAAAGLNSRIMGTWKHNFKINMGSLQKHGISLITDLRLTNEYIKFQIMHPLYTVYKDCIHKSSTDVDRNGRRQRMDLRIEKTSNYYNFDQEEQVLALNEFITSKNFSVYNKIVKICPFSIPNALARKMILPKEIYINILFPLLTPAEIDEVLSVFM
jgi:HrpA-like RNA helicase